MALRDGCWLAYFSDWSGWAVCATEIEALRYAVDHGAMSVMFVTWGEDPRDILNEERRVK